MNKWIILILLSVLSLEARGGGGGGHGGGGGARSGGGPRGGGGSRSFDRTPSMSRSLPSSSVQGRRAVDASRVNRAPQAATQAVAARPRNTTFNPQVRRQATPEQTAQFRNNWNNTRASLARNVDGTRSSFYNRHPGYNNWFNNDFYDRYNNHPAYWNARADYWRNNRWDDYNSWLGYGWNYPYYYDDSDGLYYDYSNYQPDTAVQSAPAYVPAPNEWYPLGIYALSSSPETATTSNFIYQLAVNRNGEVDGTLYNTTTNLVYDIEGSLNKQTQVISFRVANDSAPIMSTGLFNLTQDQTSILVQFVDGSEQTWTLTKLSEPQTRN